MSKILSTYKPEEAKLLLLSSPCLVGTNNKKLAHPGELNWLSHTSKKILASIEIKVSLPTNQANYLLQIIARQGYIYSTEQRYQAGMRIRNIVYSTLVLDELRACIMQLHS